MQPIDTTKKWLTAIPYVWQGQSTFWEREAGVLCLGFRALGIDCKLALKGVPEQSEKFPVVVGTSAQYEDPAWWRQWGAEAVVFYSWGAPRYEPIARAIKASGAKLIVRLDSDGVSHPRVWFWRYLSTMYSTFRDAGSWFPGSAAVLKTLLFRFFPPVFDKGVQQHLSHAHRILIESPVAHQRLTRLLLGWDRKDLADKVRTMPAQVRDEFDYDPSVAKRPQILAVGRWESTQKDAPTLVNSLAAVLAREPEYTAVIVGSGEALLQRLLQRQSPAIRSRVQIAGHVQHQQMHQFYKESRILFFSSRFEGFPNAAAEALCCGCSVVGPALIASLNYCATHSSGTVACTRTTRDLSDALGAEIESWHQGERDPREISRHWRPLLSTSSVAARIIRCCD